MRSCFNESPWQSTLLFVCIPPHAKSNLWQVEETKIQHEVNNFPQLLFFGQYFYKKEGEWVVRFISRCSLGGNVHQNQRIKRSQNARDLNTSSLHISHHWCCGFSYDTWFLHCQNSPHLFLLTSCWNWFRFSVALILINSCGSTINFLLELWQIFPDTFFVIHISGLLSLL